MQRGDFSVANLIASGLFGDGAAAMVGVGEERARADGHQRTSCHRYSESFLPQH